MKFVTGTNAALTVATVLIAAAAGAFFVDVPTKPAAWGADVLSVLHGRSPGQRAEGALLVKKAAPKLAMASAPAAPSRPRVVALPAIPAAPVAAVPIATAAAPVPALVPAAAVAAPLAAVPAVARGSAFLIPPLIIPGGGGHGFRPTATPPPGGSPPPPVPGVPEPQTWVMMIVGFGLLGGFLRRRRNKLAKGRVAEAHEPASVGAALQR